MEADSDLRLPSRALLQKAIRIFLDCAFVKNGVPDSVTQRIQFDEALSMIEILNAPPFEKYDGKMPQAGTVYSLRLGCDHYQFLKFEVRPYPCAVGFIFWVNTHDWFFETPDDDREADALREVMQRNAKIKQQIERAWARHGLPTFNVVVQETLNEVEPES